MKQTIIFLLLNFVCVYSNMAQSTIDIITLSADVENAFEDHSNALKITNVRPAAISGDFSSENNVHVIPNSVSPILIKQSFLGTARGTGVTIIRIKPPPPTRGILSTQSNTIFPNPVINELTFDSQYNLVKTYSIYDLLGFLKVNENIEPAKKHTINVSFLKPGNYLLQLNFENGNQISKQFIKN